MNKTRKKILKQCETLMLDMDGTVLDLSYDSHIWLKIIPEKLAKKRDIPITSAISFMNEHVTRMKNTLEWYCIDNWSKLLDIDVLVPKILMNVFFSNAKLAGFTPIALYPVASVLYDPAKLIITGSCLK